MGDCIEVIAIQYWISNFQYPVLKRSVFSQLIKLWLLYMLSEWVLGNLWIVLSPTHKVMTFVHVVGVSVGKFMDCFSPLHPLHSYLYGNWSEFAGKTSSLNVCCTHTHTHTHSCPILTRRERDLSTIKITSCLSHPIELELMKLLNKNDLSIGEYQPFIPI